MYCIFLSDAHLKGYDDTNQDKIGGFLEGLLKERPDAVFLLGDIFDYWVSPGGLIDPVYVPLMGVLKRLCGSGIKVSYFIGNHDFFVKDVFRTVFADMDVVEDGAAVKLDGVRCFVTHGDMIDYTDRWYRLLRRVLRSRLIRFASDALPAGAVRRIALGLSKRSREVWTAKRTMPAHVIEEYIGAKAEEGFDVVIAAHFHQPEITKYRFNNHDIMYINTGNWFHDYSYVTFKDGRFDLRYYGKKE